MKVLTSISSHRPYGEFRLMSAPSVRTLVISELVLIQ